MSRQIDLSDSNQRFAWLLWLVFLLLPLPLHGIVNAIIGLIIIHSLIFLKKEEWLGALKNPLFLAPAGYVLYLAVSIIWVENKTEGLAQLDIKLPLLVAPLLIISAQSRYPHDFNQKAKLFFLIGNVATACLALMQAVFRSYQSGGSTVFINGLPVGNYFTYTFLSENFMHPGYQSTYAGMAVLIAIWLFTESKSRLKWGYLFAAFFMLIYMLLLQGRINIIALFFVLGGSTFVLAWKKRMYKILVLPIIGLVAFALFLILAPENLKNRFLQMPNFNYDISGDEFNSATYRLAIWTCAWDVIKRNPWVGTGMGDNRQALIDAYAARGFKKGVERRFNAHNQFIETLVVGGLLGLLTMLYMLIYFARKAQSQKDYLTLLCLVFFVFSMLTESMFERRWGVILFGVYFTAMLLRPIKKTEYM